MAMMAWRIEAEGACDTLKQRNVGPFGDPDRSIALYVGVAAQRADAGTRFAEIAFQQQKICDLLDIGSAAAVLGDAHAVGDDGRIGSGIGCGDLDELRTGETGDGFDRLTR